MRKLILTTTLAIAGALATYAQGNYNFPEDKFDFGVIEEGTIASHEFEFTNSGNDSLRLKRENIRPSCGCTTPKVTEGTIAPGAKGKITAEFNSMGRPGTFNKTINIFDSTNIVKVITIKGIVIKKEEHAALTDAQLKKSSKAQIEKKEHSFGKIERGQSLSYQVKVTNSGKDTLKITSGQSACNCINYKLRAGKDNAETSFILPGKSGVLEITYAPIAQGFNKDIITFFTNDLTQPRIPVVLTAEVVDSLIEKSPVKQSDQSSPFQK